MIKVNLYGATTNIRLRFKCTISLKTVFHSFQPQRSEYDLKVDQNTKSSTDSCSVVTPDKTTPPIPFSNAPSSPLERIKTSYAQKLVTA